MITAIAIDDEPLPLEIIKRYCEQTDEIQLLETFTSTKLARAWLSQNQVDLLFLDINMPAVSGVDFYKSLDEKLMLIFTTAYTEYAVEGFNLQAIDYLLKPYSQERFGQAVKKAQDYHYFQNHQRNSSEIFIKSDSSIHRILLEQISHIEALADYVKIHLTGKKPVVSRLTMAGMETLLNHDFVRVHRSFIVALSKVDQIRNRSVFIGEIEIPIGKTYYSEIQERFIRK